LTSLGGSLSRLMEAMKNSTLSMATMRKRNKS
jgi:hypothetical protein